MVVFSPFDYAFHEDPYPIYAALRRESPVYRNDDLSFWAFARHADVQAGFRDWRTYSNTGGVALEQGDTHGGSITAVMSMLGMDPPRHDRVRSLVSRGFTPRRVQELEPEIRRLAKHYIDKFVDRGQCDFIGEFAGKLPMDVISEMVGVPVADRDQLRAWSDGVLHREEGYEGIPPSAIEASGNLLRYYNEMLADRKKHLGEDLLSALIRADIDGEHLEDLEIVGFLFLMIVAGNETTTKLLANAFYWLSKNPAERDKMRKDPSLIPQWVEETMRYDNSSQLLARTITRDHEVDGHVLREGEKVLLLVGSANRDEAVWERPDVYDIERDTSLSLSFGQGTHFCLGASLARLEAQVSLEECWARFAEYEIDESGLERVHSTNVRGFSKMPLEFPT